MVVEYTQHLNKIFHERARLGIMSILIASSEEVSFTYLTKALNMTRGNLSVHMRVLEENGYVISKKEFINKKPQTSFRVTDKGRKAFDEYIKLLEQIVQGLGNKKPRKSSGN